MNVSAFGLSNSSLQSFHNYQNNTEATALLRQPIKVNESGSFIYSDVALVEPGNAGSVFGQPEFKDFVVVEGTKDGLHWIPLENGYDARRDARWTAAITSNTAGNPSMFLENTLDLKTAFSVGDTLLFRFRLFSDATTNYWGWAIDNLYIQQIPTEARNEIIRNLTVYPNPSEGPVKIEFTLLEPSPVEIKIFDLAGKQVSNVAFQALSGRQERVVDLTHQGLYLVKVRSLWEERTVKIVVKK
jgi:Secretion system C-terminal sorting domain